MRCEYADPFPLSNSDLYFRAKASTEKRCHKGTSKPNGLALRESLGHYVPLGPFGRSLEV